FHINQVSTVPNNNLPSSANFLAPFTLSNIHFIFVAEKYASITKPVLCLIFSTIPSFSLNLSQNSDVLLHCHTIALYTGSPVSLFHIIVVSLWFVIPIESISLAVASTFDRASIIQPNCFAQISFASCSTHPAFGKY